MWQVQDVQDKDARDISVFPMSVGVVEVEWLGTERQVSLHNHLIITSL